LGRRCVYVRRSRCTRGITRARKGLLTAGVASVNAGRAVRANSPGPLYIDNKWLPVPEKRAEVAFYRDTFVLPLDGVLRSLKDPSIFSTCSVAPRSVVALLGLSRIDGRRSNLRGAPHRGMPPPLRRCDAWRVKTWMSEGAGPQRQSVLIIPLADASNEFEKESRHSLSLSLSLFFKRYANYSYDEACRGLRDRVSRKFAVEDRGNNKPLLSSIRTTTKTTLLLFLLLGRHTESPLSRGWAAQPSSNLTSFTRDRSTKTDRSATLRKNA